MNLEKKLYLTIRSLTKTTLNSDRINSFVLEGSPGVGKTYQVLEVCDKLGLERGVDYIIISSYATPLKLYMKLYRHQDKKLVILDDLDGIWYNKKTVSILKSATWNARGEREVEYNTTRKLGIPQRFKTSAKFITISNQIPKNKNPHVKAVIDRSHYLVFKPKEHLLIKYVRQVVKKIQSELSQKQKDEVLDFVVKKCKVVGKPISIRLAIKSMDVRESNKRHWREILTEMFFDSKSLTPKQIAEQLDNSSLSRSKQVEVFENKTGKSRSTFYRYIR